MTSPAPRRPSSRRPCPPSSPCSTRSATARAADFSAAFYAAIAARQPGRRGRHPGPERDQGRPRAASSGPPRSSSSPPTRLGSSTWTPRPPSPCPGCPPGPRRGYGVAAAVRATTGAAPGRAARSGSARPTGTRRERSCTRTWRRPPLGPTHAAALGPRGLVALLDEGRDVRVWSTASARWAARCRLPAGAEPWAVAWSPWPRHLATANADGTVVIWDLETEVPVRVLGPDHRPDPVHRLQQRRSLRWLSPVRTARCGSSTATAANGPGSRSRRRPTPTCRGSAPAYRGRSPSPLTTATCWWPPTTAR